MCFSFVCTIRGRFVRDGDRWVRVLFGLVRLSPVHFTLLASPISLKPSPFSPTMHDMSVPSTNSRALCGLGSSHHWCCRPPLPSPFRTPPSPPSHFRAMRCTTIDQALRGGGSPDIPDVERGGALGLRLGSERGGGGEGAHAGPTAARPGRGGAAAAAAATTLTAATIAAAAADAAATAPTSGSDIGSASVPSSGTAAGVSW